MNNLFKHQEPENRFLYVAFRNLMTAQDMNGVCLVSVYDTESGKEENLNPGVGFQWGKIDRSTIELAKSILLHHEYGSAKSKEKINRDIVYDFCREILAPMPHNEWTLSDAIVESWLQFELED